MNLLPRLIIGLSCAIPPPPHVLSWSAQGRGSKGKVHPTTDHEGPERE